MVEPKLGIFPQTFLEAIVLKIDVEVFMEKSSSRNHIVYAEGSSLCQTKLHKVFARSQHRKTIRKAAYYAKQDVKLLNIYYFTLAHNF